MSYIRISNKADKVNRLYLEKLGLSTKRDNEETIGQFGSGSKFAPIAALRNGWEWINVGEDNLGQYKMQYVVKAEGDIECIYYLYDDEVMKPSSFTIDAGVLSWDSEFQIFREAFANALDEFTSDGNPYSVDIVDEVKYEPGVFAVYLTAADELLQIITDFDKYFSIKREPLVSFSNKTKIFTPYDNEANFFYKGVLVHTDKDTNKIPIFDYEFTHITLNEERRVRNTWEIGSRVCAMFSNLVSSDDSHIAIAETLINKANVDRWEWTISTSLAETYFYDTEFSAFRTAWYNIHGDSIAVSSELMKFKAQFAMRNHQIVEIKSDFLYKLLEKVGVPCASSVLGDEVNYDFVEPESYMKAMFDKAMLIVNAHVGDYNDIVNETKVFIPQGEQDRIYGIANMIEKNVYLSTRSFKDMKTLIGTLIHEYDHINSGYDDSDTQFRNVADEHIGNLLMQIYGGN